MVSSSVAVAGSYERLHSYCRKNELDTQFISCVRSLVLNHGRWLASLQSTQSLGITTRDLLNRHTFSITSASPDGKALPKVYITDDIIFTILGFQIFFPISTPILDTKRFQITTRERAKSPFQLPFLILPPPRYQIFLGLR